MFAIILSILFFITFNKVFYEKFDEKFLLIPALYSLGMPFLSDPVYYIFSFGLYSFFTRNRNLFLRFILFLSFINFFFFISDKVYLFYPLNKNFYSLNLPISFQLLFISVLLSIYFSQEKKLFLPKNYYIFSFFLLFLPYFFPKEPVLSPDSLFLNPVKNWSFVCVYGKVYYDKDIYVNGYIMRKYKLCENYCLIFYFDEELKGLQTVCGYAVYTDGKVYLREVVVDG